MQFDYVPFPIGVLSDAIDEQKYSRMVDAFPPRELFQHKKELGNKFSLSELNHPDKYFAFIKGNPVWLEFYEYIKSENFIKSIIRTLNENNLKLGLDKVAVRQRTSSVAKKALSGIEKMFDRKPFLSSRFEFSMINGHGGYLLPHTDSPTKVITLVLTICKPNEWNRAWGGGTAINKPIDDKKYFNYLNEQLKLSEVTTLKTVEFEPNQVMLFIKTFNSFHSVDELRGPDNSLRRSLTINIEMNNNNGIGVY
jgi:hypothetical protein